MGDATEPTKAPLAKSQDAPKTRGFLYRFDDWGTPYWQVAHAVTFLYPDEPSAEDKHRVLTFFKLFPFLLPCSICGLHFANTMRDKLPLTDEVMTSRETLSRWLVDVHNMVNRRLGKKEVAYEDVAKYYTQNSSRDPRTKSMYGSSSRDQTLHGRESSYRTAVIILSIVLAGTIIGFVLYSLYGKKKKLLTFRDRDSRYEYSVISDSPFSP